MARLTFSAIVVLGAFTVVDIGFAFGDEGKEAKPELMGILKGLREEWGTGVKEALKEAGDGMDPALNARLKGLLDLEDLDGEGGGEPSAANELTGTCLVLAATRLGTKRSSTLAALERLGQEALPRAEAADIELARMTAVCINELETYKFSEKEEAELKADKQAMLPDAFAVKAATAEGRQQVLDIPDTVWAELRTFSQTFHQKTVGEAQAYELPKGAGLFALIPVLFAVGFLGKKFMDIQNEKKVQKKEKSKKKR